MYVAYILENESTNNRVCVCEIIILVVVTSRLIGEAALIKSLSNGCVNVVPKIDLKVSF